MRSSACSQYRHEEHVVAAGCSRILQTGVNLLTSREQGDLAAQVREALVQELSHDVGACCLACAARRNFMTRTEVKGSASVAHRALVGVAALPRTQTQEQICRRCLLIAIDVALQSGVHNLRVDCSPPARLSERANCS